MVQPRGRSMGRMMCLVLGALAVLWACARAGEGGPSRGDYREVGFQKIEDFGADLVNTRVKILDAEYYRVEELSDRDDRRWDWIKLPVGISPQACPCRAPADLYEDTWIALKVRDRERDRSDQVFASRDVYAGVLQEAKKGMRIDLYGVVVEVLESRRRKDRNDEGERVYRTEREHEGYGLVCEAIALRPEEGKEGETLEAGIFAEEDEQKTSKRSYTLANLPLPPLGEIMETTALKSKERRKWREGIKGTTVKFTAPVGDVKPQKGLVKYAVHLSPVRVNRSYPGGEIIELPVYELKRVSKDEYESQKKGTKRFKIGGARVAYYFSAVGSNDRRCIKLRRGDRLTVSGRIVCSQQRVQWKKAFFYKNGVPLRGTGHVTVGIKLRLCDVKLWDEADGGD